MRKIQLLILLAILLLLIGYVTYQQVTEQFHFSDNYHSKIQKYDVSGLPKQLFFAGEEVPLNNKNVARKLRVELQMQTNVNSEMAHMIERANYWLPQLSKVLKEHQVPDDFKYLAVAESNLINVESQMSAGGFWQLIPMTARELGLEVNSEVDERYHPIKSTEASCRYFRQAYQYFDNWTSVAASFNSGIGYLLYHHQKQQKASLYNLRLNAQTAGYMYRILAFKQLLEHQEEYGYKIGKDKIWDRPLEEIKITETIPDLTAFSLQHKIAYQTLRTFNPWIKSNTLTIKRNGASYILILPKIEKKEK